MVGWWLFASSMNEYISALSTRASTLISCDRGSVSSVGTALSTAEREVAGSIPGAGPRLGVLK